MSKATAASVSAVVDPTTVRLSPHFLLSDFVGCHSVYSKGYRNRFTRADAAKLVEGRYLAERVLEPLLAESPMSVSYGFISRELAQDVVRYQSPDKPSYHQWNDGAACDIVLHKHDEQNTAPIYQAASIDAELPVSRLITYSESPYLCVATKLREGDAPRRAFYENRYGGKPKAKPSFITVPLDRDEFFKNHTLRHDWRGAGYPTYHGGGIRQLQHVRVGRYSMLSDFLYNTKAVINGWKNCPTLTEEWLWRFEWMGTLYADLIDTLGVQRLSIVRAFESPVWSIDARYNWTGDDFAIDFIPPEGVDPKDVANAAMGLCGVYAYGCVPDKRIIFLSGKFGA